jgi:hypothetical protein
MLISPSLLHVKTGTGGSRQDSAGLLRKKGAEAGELIEGMTTEQVLARLDATILDIGPEMTEWQCIRKDHAAIAEAGEWADLLDALRFADQDRTMASGGKRVAPLISEGIRSACLAAIAAGDLARAAQELTRYQAVCELFSGDYAAAHLLAEVEIDLGLMKRGLASEGQLSQDLWSESAAHFANAENLLDQFDPIEEMSPLLAGTRYRLVKGMEDGASLCKDWYEDWCDLDPEDAAVHASHAVLMLPDWFGTLAGFERAARRAAVITSEVTGNAAYAIFHMTARGTLGDLLPSVDLTRFLRGLMDYQDATGCQHRANITASLLAGLAQDYKRAGAPAAYQLTKVRAALSDVLWNRLHEVHIDRWEGGPPALAFALAEVFGPALQRGARIMQKGEGLSTRVPRSL